MSLDELDFIQLTDAVDLSSFDCNDDNINEFLKEDALLYQKEKMANTFLFMKEDEVVAFFCVSNDCLNDLGETRGFTNTVWNRLHRRQHIPNAKRIKQYPSIKIGRLGVGTKYHRTGLSYELMQFIKGFVTLDHKPAARFLILDAYNQEKQIKYYQKNGYQFFLESDKRDETRLMLYDLKQLAFSELAA